MIYRQTSNICRTLVGNKLVDHSGVVGASSVGAAPITSPFSTQHLGSVDWTKTTATRDEQLIRCGIWCFFLHYMSFMIIYHICTIRSNTSKYSHLILYIVDTRFYCTYFCFELYHELLLMQVILPYPSILLYLSVTSDRFHKNMADIDDYLTTIKHNIARKICIIIATCCPSTQI